MIRQYVKFFIGDINMKKITKVIAIAMALMMLFSACGENTKKAAFDYSAPIDDKGFWKGIKALDYVTLPDFGSIGVLEEDIDSEIQYLMNQQEYMKKIENTTDAAGNFDTVNIDYVGKIDGVAFDGGSTNGAGTEVTIGVTSYIDGFLDQLIGHHGGETFDINVTFSENYGNADLAGKDAVFTIDFHYIVEYEAYELSDNFVRTVLYDQYGWETVADLREGIKDYLYEEAVYAATEFSGDLPEVIKTHYVERMSFEVEQMAATYGMSADDYIAAVYSVYGFTTMDDFKQAMEESADEAVRNYLYYQAVAETYNISVDNSDMEAYYNKNGMSEDKADAEAFYGKPFITSMVLYGKVTQYIYDMN